MVSYPEWVEAFQREADEPATSNPLVPLRQYIAQGQVAQLPHFDMSNTREAIGSAYVDAPRVEKYSLF